MSARHDALVAVIDETERFFLRSISALDDADSGFVPAPGMMSAAAQIAHTAITIDWFLGGALGPSGWDMDFEAHMAKAASFESVAEAKAELEASCDRARTAIRAAAEEKLAEPLPPDDPIMPGCPRGDIVHAIADHSAHHRGALSVYARLRGKTPPIPYMDEAGGPG